MVNLFQILNQFVLLFRKNVIEKSSMIWRVRPLVKINIRISETPVYDRYSDEQQSNTRHWCAREIAIWSLQSRVPSRDKNE
jgi:hypothetical protein